MYEKRNVLINFRGGMGDFIILTPTLRSIVDRGEYNLIFMGGKNVQQLVEGYNRYFTNAFYVDYTEGFFRKCLTILNVFWKLRKKSLYACITPVCSLGKLSYLITKLSRAMMRIGFNHERTLGVYTHTIDIDCNKQAINENRKILKLLNVSDENVTTELIIPEDNIKNAEKYFYKLDLDMSKKIIAIAPLNKGMKGYPSKAWPLFKYIELMVKIISIFDSNIVLMGSNNELCKLSLIKKDINLNRICFQEKKFTIYDSAAVLKRCSLLVCNDGGLMHVAAAINIPVISLWGPTDPNVWGYREKKNFFSVISGCCEPCRRNKSRLAKCKESKCLNSISVDEIVGICKRILSENITNK
ncbi:glycosyltransferase family 9 protein [Candidatus Pacearchaeota archaeon]|nr:glycosyltransferase family 9 protein [Candidatus Pacearchaeota archaeon]